MSDNLTSGAAVGSLPFIVRLADDVDDDTKGLFRHGGDVTGQRDIPVPILRQNLGRTAGQLREAFHDFVAQFGPLRLDEVQIGLEISASGGVALIGTGAVKAAITLVFRVSEEPEK